MSDGQLLDHVPERYLETALPKVGGSAIVLTGEHRLSKGRLLERSSDCGTGVIQVFDDMNVLKLSLDDIAEWCGLLDDDLEL
jgi:G patch domain/KOW motif-containing protein